MASRCKFLAKPLGNKRRCHFINSNKTKNIILIKCDEYLKDKIKLSIYYKDVFKSNQENQKYIFILTSAKKKIKIAKIQAISQELIMKLGAGKFSKHHTLESIIFVTLRKLNMKRIFSYNALQISKLDCNFKIYVTISTFLTSQVIKTIVRLEHFS